MIEKTGALDILLWVALPYVSATIFVVGLVLRRRYDNFGWTSRSSQLYEGRLLRIASPLFHFGMLAVIGGHVVGLLIPESFTSALGLTEREYHLTAVTAGMAAGVATIVGLLLLIYRRRTIGSVFAATTKNDKAMYVFLLGAIMLGVLTTMLGSGVVGKAHNYRADVSPWFRSIIFLNPKPELMASAPLSYRVHVFATMLLFIIWPFTRLVHALSAPAKYLFRPYVIYRSKDSQGLGNREKQRRGW
jgi:nitrate reductase gamma subunit